MNTPKDFEHRIRNDLYKALLGVFDQHKTLTISTNWQVLDKTYGEVGGRFLEDFLLSELNHKVDILSRYNIIRVDAPDGRRTMEDLIAVWEIENIPEQRLLISIKGHREGSASNPNLVSLQKAKNFYSNHPNHTHFFLLVIHYSPERIPQDGFHMTIQRIDLCLLKDLEEKHLSLQTVGAGGQFLLSHIDHIQSVHRTPAEFYEIICQKENLWRSRRRKHNVE